MNHAFDPFRSPRAYTVNLLYTCAPKVASVFILLFLFSPAGGLAAETPQVDVRPIISQKARLEIERIEGGPVEYRDVKCVDLLKLVQAGGSPGLAEARPSRPILVKTGGQSGAGKSGMVKKIVERLKGDPGGVTHFDWDAMRQYMPADYVRHLHMLDPELSALYRPDVMATVSGQVIQAALEDKRNLILDGSLDSRADTRKNVEDYFARGYQVEFEIIAVHPLLARAGDLLRMARTSVALQDAFEAASQLPPAERDAATMEAKRRFFPRHSVPQRHEADLLNQIESLGELERLMAEGKISQISIWERDGETPTFVASQASFGQAIAAYKMILSKWSEKDKQRLREQLAEARTLLGKIRLPHIDVQKYFGYAADIERAANGI